MPTTSASQHLRFFNGVPTLAYDWVNSHVVFAMAASSSSHAGRGADVHPAEEVPLDHNGYDHVVHVE
jgi:hypothetical protein